MSARSETHVTAYRTLCRVCRCRCCKAAATLRDNQVVSKWQILSASDLDMLSPGRYRVVRERPANAQQPTLHLPGVIVSLTRLHGNCH